MPFTFVYLIALVLVAALAFFAPHTRGLCTTMAELYSIFLVIAGSIETFQRRRIE